MYGVILHAASVLSEDEPNPARWDRRLVGGLGWGERGAGGECGERREKVSGGRAAEGVGPLSTASSPRTVGVACGRRRAARRHIGVVRIYVGIWSPPSRVPKLPVADCCPIHILHCGVIYAGGATTVRMDASASNYTASVRVRWGGLRDPALTAFRAGRETGSLSRRRREHTAV